MSSETVAMMVYAVLTYFGIRMNLTAKHSARPFDQSVLGLILTAGGVIGFVIGAGFLICEKAF